MLHLSKTLDTLSHKKASKQNPPFCFLSDTNSKETEYKFIDFRNAT